MLDRMPVADEETVRNRRARFRTDNDVRFVVVVVCLFLFFSVFSTTALISLKNPRLPTTVSTSRTLLKAFPFTANPPSVENTIPYYNTHKHTDRNTTEKIRMTMPTTTKTIPKANTTTVSPPSGSPRLAPPTGAVVVQAPLPRVANLSSPWRDLPLCHRPPVVARLWVGPSKINLLRTCSIWMICLEGVCRAGPMVMVALLRRL